MPHSPEDKKRVLTRLRRIRGQSEALERAVEAGTDCASLLQQIAALRGATNGLMAEVLDTHLRETFIAPEHKSKPKGSLKSEGVETDIDNIMRILRTYLK